MRIIKKIRFGMIALLSVAIAFFVMSCGNTTQNNENGSNGTENEKPDNKNPPADSNSDDKQDSAPKPDSDNDPNPYDTSEEQSAYPAPISGTSEDGKYSYEVKDGMLTLKYKGNNKPNLEIYFYTPDSESNWGWSWFVTKRIICNAENSINIFDECYLPLWKLYMKRPETQNIFIQIHSNDENKNVLGKDKGIETQFIVAERENAFLDSKDYSKKTFTPKSMNFNEEDAKTAVSKMKMGANFSNHFDTYNNDKNPVLNFFRGKDMPPFFWETYWGEQETTIEHIKYLKSLGFSAVRLNVTWDDHLDSNYNILPGWMNRIQEVVDWYMDEDFYVILNSHHDSGDSAGGKNQWIYATYESYNKSSERYKKLWEQISDYFKNYSEKLIFANPNEICESPGVWGHWSATPETYDAMLKWNQLFVDTVRTSGGNNTKRNLVVSALNTSDSEEILEKTKLPKDTTENHLIFEIHSYRPLEFVYPECIGLTDADRTFANSGFDAQSILDPVFNFSKNHNNIPVIIGEWGIQEASNINVCPDEEKTKFASVFVSEALSRGFGMFIWGPQWFFGDTSIDNMKVAWFGKVLPSPLYLEAIQNAVKTTEFGNYVPPAPIEPDFAPDISYQKFKGTFEVNGEFGHCINFDITDLFQSLPNVGDIVKISFTGIVNKNVGKLSIYLADTSSAANGWLDLIGEYENRAKMYCIASNEPFSVEKNLTIANAPKEQVMLRIEYYPDWFNEAADITIE